MTATLTFTPSAALTWQKAKLGGLGFNTSIAHAPDGSWSLVSTDVGGFYRRASADTAWTQIVQTAGFPSALADPQNFTNSGGNAAGCWAIAIAGNSTTAYAVVRAKVVKTNDSGATWSQTNFAIVGGGTNDLPSNNTNGLERFIASKMVVDPDDPNTVLLCSPTTGPYRTVDGGATWTQPTGLPDVSVQTSGNRYGMFACDKGSTVGSGRVWFAFAYGSGLYRSTDNGATWASAGTGFDTYTQASDLVYKASGQVYVVDSSATDKNVRVWTQGSGYTSITTTPTGFKVRYLSVNPTTASELIVTTGGASGPNEFCRSLDTGATWAGPWTASHLRSQHTETRIMSYVQDQDGAGSFAWSFAKPKYHPTNGRLYWPSGYGTCWSDTTATAFSAPSTTDKVVINDFAAGMEELVAMFGIILPDHSMVLASQDKMVLTVTSPKTYALPAFPVGTNLGNGYYLDYVEGTPSKIGYAIAGNISGYSDDSGATGTAFAVQPVTNIGGGNMLRLDDTHFLRFPGQNYRPRYTTDKGATWNIPTFTGGTLPADGTTNGFGHGLIDFNERYVTKDRNNPGVVYCYNYGEGGSNTMRGCWKSTDYGATWANLNSNGLILTSGTQGSHTTLIHADGMLYLTTGSTGSGYVQESTNNLLFSSPDGVTWTAVSGVTEALQICWGAPASGSSNKTIWIVGWYNHVFGIWYSIDKGGSWTKLSDYPNFDNPKYIAADPVTFGRLLLGGDGTGHSLRA